MAYATIDAEDYGTLILDDHLNQIKSNLEAIHDRLVAPLGNANQVRKKSFTLSNSVAGTWVIPASGLELVSSNYPAHKKFLVMLAGKLLVYQFSATVTTALIDLHINKTLAAPGGTTGSLVGRTGGAAGDRTEHPVTLIREIEMDGGSNWLAFPALRLLTTAGGGVDPPSQFFGYVWVKEM